MRIVLKGVTVEYEAGLPSATVALRGVDLEVREGECVAVIGPTGSGKTTLLEVMAGLAPPGSGTCALGGTDEARGLREAVGLAYQFPESQLFEETVEHDVAFGPRRQGLPESEVKRRVAEALAATGLDHRTFAGRSPLSLSAGEKRRAALAGILALSRPFLLLDEPTAGLDPSAGARIVELVLDQTRVGRGVVVVTHDLNVVEEVAERTVVLSDGRVAADRTTFDVLSDGPFLRSLGLVPPPRFELVERLRDAAFAQAERVAELLLRGARV